MCVLILKHTCAYFAQSVGLPIDNDKPIGIPINY